MRALPVFGLLLLTGCGIVKVGGVDSETPPSSAKGASVPIEAKVDAAFSKTQALLSAADASLASNPEKAAASYLQARAQAYRDATAAGNAPPSDEDKGHFRQYVMGARTRLEMHTLAGRGKALRALGKDDEVLVDFYTPFDPGSCPKTAADLCREHADYLAERFANAVSKDRGIALDPVFDTTAQGPSSMYFHTVPAFQAAEERRLRGKKGLVPVRLQLTGKKANPDGTVTLIAKGTETTLTDESCRDVGTLEIEARTYLLQLCRQTDRRVRGATLTVRVPAAEVPDASPPKDGNSYGDVVTVIVLAEKVKRSGDSWDAGTGHAVRAGVQLVVRERDPGEGPADAFFQD